jgi:phospholipid/cholesterol/gamma-HCH transport system substrate-binding protein
VSMSGVEVGRVSNIGFDSTAYKAVVTMRMDSNYNKIPTDSDASIYTQGLLGGKYIGMTAGGADTYLKDKDKVDFTQSALVIEKLIGQFLANFAKGDKTDKTDASKNDTSDKSGAADSSPAQRPSKETSK